MESNVTSGRFASTTCLVKFVVGDDTPVTTQLDSPSAVQASENAEEAANEFQHFFDETEKKEESPAAEAPATQ
jgi:hypothetical protein